MKKAIAKRLATGLSCRFQVEKITTQAAKRVVTANSSIHAASRMPKYYAALKPLRAIAPLEQRPASYESDDSLRFWFRGSRGSSFGLGGDREFNFVGLKGVVFGRGMDHDEIARSEVASLGWFVLIVGPR
jgi:hypothetical protein